MKRAALHFLVVVVLILCLGNTARADSSRLCDDAEESYDQGDFDRAIAGFTACIEEGPPDTADLVDAHFMRGLSRLDSGDTEASIPDFDHAIRLDPSYTAAYGNRGYALYSTGQTARAIEDYNRTIGLGGTYAERIYFFRGLAYYRLGNYDAAIHDYDQAVQFDANEAFRVHFN
jgi:tetratricopeptide (TPR) repeat protein